MSWSLLPVSCQGPHPVLWITAPSAGMQGIGRKRSYKPLLSANPLERLSLCPKSTFKYRIRAITAGGASLCGTQGYQSVTELTMFQTFRLRCVIDGEKT